MTRMERRRRGHDIARALGQESSATHVPGLADFEAEVMFASIWDRPGLPRADRALCTLAALSVLQRLEPLRSYVATGLDLGLTPRNILEVLVQVGLYAGFVTSETSARVAHEVFAARGLVVPPDPPADATDEALDARGRELMQKLHAERASEGYAAPGNTITGALYPSAIRYGYGELWLRPGLDHRQRMLAALAAFTAMPLPGLLRKFSRSALNIGLSRQEIVEAVIQTAPYSGFPRALEGLGILSDTLA